jgi:DNA-binding MarR family transcriptional regulator
MSVSQSSAMLIELSNFYSKLSKQQDQWMTVHGISFREFLIMHHLSNSSARNMRRIDLAVKIGLSASGVTRMLNPMEKVGIVGKEENARDARVSLVALTDAGEEMYRNAVKTLNQRSKLFISSLDENKRAALAQLTSGAS